MIFSHYLRYYIHPIILFLSLILASCSSQSPNGMFTHNFGQKNAQLNIQGDKAELSFNFDGLRGECIGKLAPLTNSSGFKLDTGCPHSVELEYKPDQDTWWVTFTPSGSNVLSAQYNFFRVEQ